MSWPMPDPGPWVERWLSAPRFGRYLAAADGDRARALALYEWNLALGQAMMRDVAHFEVALRNAYDQAMAETWQGDTHWLLDPASPALAPLWRRAHGRRTDINARNRDSVSQAVARTGGASAAPDAVVSELPFGFWRHLADTGHEQTVWVPHLHRAWPRKTSRLQVDQATQAINEARNKAAHHEPLFGKIAAGGVMDAHTGLMTLLAMLSPELAAYVQNSSDVAKVSSRRP